MPALSNQFRNLYIDWLFRGQALPINGVTLPAGSGPATLYFGLFATNPTQTTNGVEVGVPDYARAPIVSSLANWAGTNGVGSAALSTGTSGQTSNNIEVVFPTPGNWGTVVGIGLFDAATGGVCLYYNPLPVPRSVISASVPPVIPAGHFILNFK